MFKNIIKVLGGDPSKRDVQRYSEIVDHINKNLTPIFEKMSDDELKAKSDELKEKVQAELEGVAEEDRKAATQAVLDDVLPQAFALVREASSRTTGLRHYDVQLIGGMVLHAGRIAEMQTGEGKTLVATLPMYLNALTGRTVHLVTVNDYLARRDAKWMGAIYHLLGMSVGILQDASRTENGLKAFIYDPTRESSQEDSHQMRLAPRQDVYECNIVYGTNSEFGFDYLRDNMANSLSEIRQRERFFAIVDEVDNILIDEARTPLIISGPAGESAALYQELARAVKTLRREHYEISERERSININDEGYQQIETALGRTLRDPDRPEDLTPEQATLQSHLEQAMRAEFIFKKNKDYLVQGGRVLIVDEHTGRTMPGRRWSDGLHQAVEAKEAVPVQAENVTYATITLQNFFRLYDKLAGMSGTALTESEEFDKIYKLAVVPIPKHVEYLAERNPEFVQRDFKENGYKFVYFARKGSPDVPLYYRRKDYPDLVYRSEEGKFRAIMQDALARHVRGQPLLIGTTSVDLSEHISKRFTAEPLRKLALVMLLRDKWFEVNNVEMDGRAVSDLEPLNKSLDSLNPSDMRAMAKELGLTLNPTADDNIKHLADMLGLEEKDYPRLRAVLDSGIKHKVLNAKKHDEESQIILNAGAFGAVMIATNMAGRGVDIKLGGTFDETALSGVNRVLIKAGNGNAFEMRHEDRLAALQKLTPEDFGIYVAEVEAFKEHIELEKKVREIGGLHVIGSERHEARRIDNQLRGRAARQGDPGSSRFYLSLEDELMRRFGGSNVSGLMQTLKIDDALPIEHGIVDKTIEQSQQRVEGYNFDVRKHLLEYDDVLNQQRGKIYTQRERIFTKNDLTDDVDEMLIAEVERRVELAISQEDGRWKLLAWLDEVQTPFQKVNGEWHFQFSISQIIDSVKDKATERAAVKEALLEVAKGASDSARDQLLKIVDDQLNELPDRVKERADAKKEAAENSFDSWRDEARELGKPLDIRNVTKAMTDAAEINIRLPKDFFTEQTEKTLKKAIGELIDGALGLDAADRFLKWLAARTGIEVKIELPAWDDFDWDAFGDLVTEAVTKAYDSNTQNHLDEIARVLDELLKNFETFSHDVIGRVLMDMAVSRDVIFDKKTHKRETRFSQRFPYIYYAAELIEKHSKDDLRDEILDHLHTAQDEQKLVWGEAELMRLGTARLMDLDSESQASLKRTLGEEYEPVASKELSSLSGGARDGIRAELGRLVQHGLHRFVMLSVSNQLWVDYLTTIEGVRTSISLEAYAQRDPLTAYKSKAFDLFHQLLVDMRAGVVSKLLTYRPRTLAEIRGDTERGPQRKSLGRNDPCWCGSGKKYKNCHLGTDSR